MSETSPTKAVSSALKARPNGDSIPREGAVREAQLRWDDQKMATSFANVVNIQSTREQVDLFFGTNQTWNIADGPAVSVDLTNRIILTPFAAKRLLAVLGGVLREYESRHGPLEV